MSSDLYIDLPRTHFAPGETISGKVLWALEAIPGTLELTAEWWTEGRGDRDQQDAVTTIIPAETSAGEKDFAMTLPAHPYSFKGALITLKWALRLTATRCSGEAVEEITVAPQHRIIELKRIEGVPRRAFWSVG